MLISSINYAPDHAGIAIYSTDFAAYLAEQGDQVRIVTGFPYYPRWKKRQEDVGSCFRRETHDSGEVFRGYLYVPPKVTTTRRIWHELTFCLFAFCNFLRAGKPDVIILFTPPFFLGMVGALAKWLWRRPLVINIQDLPLDASLALGMLKYGLAARTMQALESWIYRRADLVVTISPEMLESVRCKGVPSCRLFLVPNWIDVEDAGKVVTKGAFLSQHSQAQGKFTIAYAGNLGIKQGIDCLLELANRLQTNQAVHIFIVGDGADKPRLLTLAEDLSLKNVTFLPFMSPDAYKLMLADVDVIFVAQRSGAGNNFFPSKLLGLMARAKPLLVAADTDSELARVVTKVGCGLVSPYGDVTKLARNLNRFLASQETLSEIGANGRHGVIAFDRKKVLSAWRDRVLALCNT